MSILNSLLSQLGSAAKNLAPQIVPGSDKLIAAGEALMKAFTTVKTINGGTAPPDAEAGHDALFEKVKAHADSTLGRLEGE